MSTTLIQYKWRFTDEFGKRRITTWLLTEADARERWGSDCEPVEHTKVVREVPDDPMSLMGGGIRTMPPDRG